MFLKSFFSHKIIVKRIRQGYCIANFSTNYGVQKQTMFYNQQVRFETIDHNVVYFNFIGPNAKRLQTGEVNSNPIRQVRLYQPKYSMFISLVAKSQEFVAGANRQKFLFKMMDVFKLGVWSPNIHGDQFYCDLSGISPTKGKMQIVSLKLLLKQQCKQGNIVQNQSVIQQPFNQMSTIGSSNATYKFNFVNVSQSSKIKFELKSLDMIFLQQKIRNIMRKLNGMQTASICQKNIGKRKVDEISQFYYKYET